MHAAHELEPIVDGLLLTIIIAYLGIAYQFWTRRRGVNGRATRALSQLVVIFVFCTVCGYLPRLVEIPATALLAAHAVLAGAAWAYLLAGQVDRLSVAVDFADVDDEGGRHSRSAARRDAINAEIEACARVAEQAGSRVTAGLIRQRQLADPDEAPARESAEALVPARSAQAS